MVKDISSLILLKTVPRVVSTLLLSLFTVSETPLQVFFHEYLSCAVIVISTKLINSKCLLSWSIWIQGKAVTCVVIDLMNKVDENILIYWGACLFLITLCKGTQGESPPKVFRNAEMMIDYAGSKGKILKELMTRLSLYTLLTLCISLQLVKEAFDVDGSNYAEHLFENFSIF